MSIDFLDTIRNRLPVSILEGKDIKGSMLIDPDPNLPPSFLQDSAVLRTDTKVITFYDDQGLVKETLDVSEVDLTTIETQIAALQSEVQSAQGSALSASNQAVAADGKATEAKTAADTAQERADDAHKLATDATAVGSSAMAEATAAAALAADNRLKISEHTLRIDTHTGLISELEGKTTTNRITAETALETANSTSAALNATNEAVGDLTGIVEKHQGDIENIAGVVDEQNETIVQLDDNVVTLGRTVDSNTQRIGLNEAAIAAIELDDVIRTGQNIEVASIKSDGSFFMDEMYIPPENVEAGNYTEVKGEYAFTYGDKGKILTFDDVSMDLKGKKLTGLHIPTDSTDAIRKAEFDTLSEKVTTNESGIVAVNTELTNQSSQISSLQNNSATKDELNSVSSDVSGLQSTALIKGVDADVDSTKFSVRNKPVKDIVDGTDESDAVSKKQLDQINTTLTARIDGIEAGGGVDLSGYAQLDSDVSFDQIILNNKHADAINDFKIHVNSEQNTIFDLVGNTEINTHAKDSSDNIRSIYIDTQGRSTFANNIKASQIHGQESWTNVSTDENAKYIKLDEDNKVQIGAHSVVDFSVNGSTPLTLNQNNVTLGVSTLRSDDSIKLQSGNVDNLEITNTGVKAHRDIDMNTQNIKNVGDIEIANNRIILGGSARNLKLENIASVHGTTVHSHGVIFNENEIVIDSPKITLKEDGANRLSIEDHKIKMFTCQLKDLLDAEDDFDAVTLKQAKSFSSKTESFLLYGGTNDLRISETEYPNPHIRYNSSSTGTQLVYLDHAKNNNPVTIELRNESHSRSIELRPMLNGQGYNKTILPPNTHFTGFYTPSLKNSDGTTADAQFYGFIGYIQVPPTNKNVFALAEDIPLEDMPADEIYLTGDQGIVETYLNDEGATQIRQVSGYNVPELENEINELQEHKNNNAPAITYFKNSNQVIVPYTHEHPKVTVQILDTAQPLQDTSLTLLDNDSGLYSGVYNNVGALSIGSTNTWITNYVYHNAYKHTTANYYVVYDQSITNWIILSTDVLHTTANTDVGSVKTNLNQAGTLPESTGSQTVTLSVNDINSIEFIDAVADTRIDEANKQVIVKFGSVYPSGKIIIS